MLAVEMVSITKKFQRVTANKDVNFTVNKGEIHSLLGENGAGKTTLMRILYGMHKPTNGNINLFGKPVNITSPADAIKHGISMVHQHFMLIEPYTVAENVVLGYEKKKGVVFDKDQAIEDVRMLSEQYGLSVDPKAKVEDLSVGMKQRVEILKALYRKAEILILDEPTAVLTPSEVDDLFNILNEMRSLGKTVIIITHKLKETLKISDNITIIRAGQVVSTLPTHSATEQLLAELMVGRKVNLSIERKPLTHNNIKLELKNIYASKKSHGIDVLKGINFNVHEGEIIGIAGVEGNGQTELIEVLTGLRKTHMGQMFFNNHDITNQTASHMIEQGIGHIPEDRGLRGYIHSFSLQENCILGYHKTQEFSKHNILRKKQIKQSAERTLKEHDVRAASVDTLAGELSGGNQQKMIVGRVLSQNPDVIIAAQPTRGVDIGAIEHIHKRLMAMRDSGKSIILFSAELDEIKKLSDRILVIYEGKIVSDTPANTYNAYQLGKIMTTGKVTMEASK